MSVQPLEQSSQLHLSGSDDLHGHYESKTPYVNKMAKLRGVFSQQSVFPPGDDTYIAKAFEAAANHQQYLDFTLSMQEVRSRFGRPLTYAHAANLLVPITNYLMMEQGHLDFIKDPDLYLDKKDGWTELLYSFLDPENSREFSELYFNKDNQTNKTERGRIVSFIGHSLYGDEPITLFEFGGSALRIPRYLADGGIFPECKDTTSYRDPNGKIVRGIIQASARRPINVAKAIGIDRSNPLSSEENIKWLLACRHFDRMGSSNLRKGRQELEEYRESMPDNVHFRQADLTRPLQDQVDDIELGKATIVNLSLIAHQIPNGGDHDKPSLRNMLYQNAMDAVDPENGVVVVSDYFEKDANGNYIISNSRKYHDFCTLVMGPAMGGRTLQVATYKDTSLDDIRPGEHFEEYMDIVRSRSEEKYQELVGLVGMV